MVTRSDYTPDSVVAARSVLVELTHLLAEYRDDIVVIGGWVPTLLLGPSAADHVGTLDLRLGSRPSRSAGTRLPDHSQAPTRPRLPLRPSPALHLPPRRLGREPHDHC